MVSTTELMAAVVEAAASKRLQPRDALVLLGVMAHVNWRSGRANVTVRALAKELNIQESNCSSSIKRLRDERLLARCIDPVSHHAFFLLNPRLGWVGSTQRRGHLFQQFDEATKVPTMEDLDLAG